MNITDMKKLSQTIKTQNKVKTFNAITYDEIREKRYARIFCLLREFENFIEKNKNNEYIKTEPALDYIRKIMYHFSYSSTNEIIENSLEENNRLK